MLGTNLVEGMEATEAMVSLVSQELWGEDYLRTGHCEHQQSPQGALPEVGLGIGLLLSLLDMPSAASA